MQHFPETKKVGKLLTWTDKMQATPNILSHLNYIHAHIHTQILKVLYKVLIHKDI